MINGGIRIVRIGADIQRRRLGVGMPQHLLDLDKRRLVVIGGAGSRAAQIMRCQAGGRSGRDQASGLTIRGDELADDLGGQRAEAAVRLRPDAIAAVDAAKDGPAPTRMDADLGKPGPEAAVEVIMHLEPARLLALAGHKQPPAPAVLPQIRERELHHFLPAQAQVEHQVEDGQVTRAFQGRGVDARAQAPDLGDTEPPANRLAILLLELAVGGQAEGLSLRGGQDAIAEGDGQKGAHGGDPLGGGIRTVAGGRAGGAEGIEECRIDQPQHTRRVFGRSVIIPPRKRYWNNDIVLVNKTLNQGCPSHVCSR
jgi:hypothetical protein